MIEDRALLIALFNAIGALAKRMTGDDMLLCIKDDRGNWFHFYPNDSHVTWITSVEVEGHSGAPRVHPAMHCRLHASLGAMPSVDCLLPEPLATDLSKEH